MKNIFLISLVSLALLSSTSFNSIWKNDPPHSQLGFTVTHLGINEVSGVFNDVNVTVNAAKPDFSDAIIEVSAKTSSIDTRVEQRNNHLKSADFFDVEKYPVLTFKSTSIKNAGKAKYTVTGDLTIHGVTKQVTLDFLYRGTVENPMSKKPTAGMQFSGTIKRSDFGIGGKFPAAMIGDEVYIKGDGEFVQ